LFLVIMPQAEGLIGTILSSICSFRNDWNDKTR
jgi:hypothetical protein